MAKAKKLAAVEVDEQEVAKQIASLTAFISRLQAQKEQTENNLPPHFKDENGNIIKRGPGRRIYEITEELKRLNARLAELQALLTV